LGREFQVVDAVTQNARLPMLNTKCYLEKGDLRFLGTSEKCGKLTKYISLLVEAVWYVTVVNLNLIRYANWKPMQLLK